MLPEVNDYLLHFVDIEGEIIVAALVHQILYLFPVVRLIIASTPSHHNSGYAMIDMFKELL